MLSIERRKIILSRLRADKRVLVSELKLEFDVSEETIRRDLHKLESEGYAKRSYGGAVLSEYARDETPYDIRRREGVDEKTIIARLAAELINDGEYIVMDESSTSYYIARELKRKKGLTVITNSMEIIREIAGTSGWTILCTGGELRASAPSFAGHQAESMVRSYHVDKAIISCGSLDIRAGFTDRHEDTALIKRAMISAAHKSILAADHTKFGKVAFARIGELNELDTIVTDTAPDARWTEALNGLGVKLMHGGAEIE